MTHIPTTPPEPAASLTVSEALHWATGPAIESPPALWLSSETWTEADIPARPWIAPGYFLRGCITVVSGAGSAGKSSLVVAWTACLALGLSFHRMRAPAPVRVMSYSVEDDLHELRRRYSATLRQIERTPAPLMRHLSLIGPTGSGALLTYDPHGKALVNTAAMDSLEAEVISRRPDILFLDPFVELHGAEENDNTAVRSVMARFRALAVKHNMAVVLLHHNRKGIATAGDPDSMRGASAISGAARVVLTLTVMAQEEADGFGIPQDRRRYYARLDAAKMNYAPVRDAEWFERTSFVLDNGPAGREDGDGVGAMWPWTPPSTAVPAEALDRLEAIIGQGTTEGPYSPKLSKDTRSVRTAMQLAGIDGQGAQKKALEDLLTAGRVTVGSFKRAGRGDPRQGLRNEAGEPARVTWTDPGTACSG
ncbi:hypothetical protein ABVK25_008772 [Lepraria finkii]|uniref:AAA family ATPase n=1 Tax=Lepraria finkii TaxID=1340010 RepID=A0ABR4AZE1_9LECA